MGFIGRFAAAGIGLVIVAVLLTHHLLAVIRDWRTTTTINTVLETELAREPSTSLEKAFYHREDDRIDVLSMVRSSHVLPPPKVKRIEDALAQKLGRTVRLFIRASITKDVTATGATNLLTEINLNGDFTKRVLSPTARVETIAEQAVREMLADIPNVVLDDIDLINLPVGPVVVVSIQSPRTPLPAKVQWAEQVIQNRVGDPRVRLLVRTIESTDVSSTGLVLLGQAHFGVRTPEEIALQNTIQQQVKREIEKIPNLLVPNADAVKGAHGWVVRAEVVGSRVIDPKEVQAVEKALLNAVKQPVELTIWARSDLIVTGQRYFSMQGYREATSAQQPRPVETQAVPERESGVAR
jgi:hypothetical protein